MSEKAVFIYNGFTDLDCLFDGRVFHFPYQKTTKVEDVLCTSPDESKRNHESDPRPDAMLERTYPAKEFVQMILTRHNQNFINERVVWVGEKEPTEQERKRCDEFGRIRKRKQVEEALSERKQALIKGGRPDLDPQIVDWMLELGVYDETFNPAPPSDMGKDLVAAIREASKPQPQPELAKK